MPFDPEAYLKTFEETKQRGLGQLAQTKQAQKQLVKEDPLETGEVPKVESPTKEPIRSELPHKLLEEFRRHKELQEKSVFGEGFRDFMESARTSSDTDALAQRYLALQENVRPTIYNDAGPKKPGGKATIGKGHLIKPNEVVNVWLPEGGRMVPIGKKAVVQDGKLDHEALLRYVEEYGAEVELNLPKLGRRKVTPKSGLTSEDLTKLSGKDYKTHKANVNKLIKKYGLSPTPKQYTALVAISFNLGPSFAEKFKSLREPLEQKDWNKLSENITKFTWSTAQGKRLPGLLKNRIRLATLLKEEQ